jgi:hypothetical protein
MPERSIVRCVLTAVKANALGAWRPEGNGRSRVNDYQFNDANHFPSLKATFAEGLEIKNLGTANG